jgi:hypothetical protein
MDWILAKLPILIFVLVLVARAFSALSNSKKAKREQEAKDPAEEQRRVAEIQEQIRRQIAARRQGTPAQRAEPASPPLQRPIARRAETKELPDPFGGGTIRRMFEEMERKLQPASPPVEPPPLVQHRRAEFERQQQLADQMKALEEQRALAQKRAAHLAEEQKADAASESGMLVASRSRTLDDLRDPQALRRAFVLREVLGTPVGLR